PPARRYLGPLDPGRGRPPRGPALAHRAAGRPAGDRPQLLRPAVPAARHRALLRRPPPQRALRAPPRASTARPPRPARRGPAAYPRPRRAAKNPRNGAAHSSASTPPRTAGRWVRRGSASTSSTEPAAPALGSAQPKTTRGTRASTIAPAHIAHGSSV